MVKGEELILKVDNKHYHLVRDLTEGLFDTSSLDLGNSQIEFRIRNCALVNYLRESAIKRHRLHFQAHWIYLPLQ